MQLQRKHASVKVEKLLGFGDLNVFSVHGPCRSFIGDTEGRLQSIGSVPRVQAGSNTSTVPLRVVGSEEKEPRA
jgi:hypothetical protein